MKLNHIQQLTLVISFVLISGTYTFGRSEFARDMRENSRSIFDTSARIPYDTLKMIVTYEAVGAIILTLLFGLGQKTQK